MTLLFCFDFLNFYFTLECSRVTTWCSFQAYSKVIQLHVCARSSIHVCAQSPSPIWLFLSPLTVADQTPLSMGFSRQEYWSGLSKLHIYMYLCFLSKLPETVKDKEAWHAAVYEVTKSWTWLSDWTLFFNFFSHLGYWRILSRVPCAI